MCILLLQGESPFFKYLITGSGGLFSSDSGMWMWNSLKKTLIWHVIFVVFQPTSRKKMVEICVFFYLRHTLPKTNIAPENGWLEYYFPFGDLFSWAVLVSGRVPCFGVFSHYSANLKHDVTSRFSNFTARNVQCFHIFCQETSLFCLFTNMEFEETT